MIGTRAKSNNSEDIQSCNEGASCYGVVTHCMGSTPPASTLSIQTKTHYNEQLAFRINKLVVVANDRYYAICLYQLPDFKRK